MEKIESALHSAYYPGSFPFVHGLASSIAGAMTFYICQAHAFVDENKRTAAIAAITLFNINGLDLRYNCNDSEDKCRN